MVWRRLILAGVAVAVIGAVAWALVGGRAVTGGIGDGQTSREPGAPVPAARVATVLAEVPFRRDPAGRPIRDESGANDVLTRVGQRVTILEDRVLGQGRWERVYVDVDAMAWPSDFFAWLPDTVDGSPVLRVEPEVTCPADATAATLGALGAVDRLRCAEGRVLAFQARTVFPVENPGYLADPVLFGGHDRRGILIGLVGPGLAHGMDADTTGPWLDASVAPGVELPPVDVDIAVVGEFDHPAAAGCRRTRDPQLGDGPEAGLPPEAAADSVLWCRTRFVITSWTITAGPERRPTGPGLVQLHRPPVTEGSTTACAGVSMDGPVTLRIDLSQPDPVWIDVPGSSIRAIPVFGREWTVVLDPRPGISDDAGAVLHDGTQFDPDGPVLGHQVCPRGAVVSID
jgi:hypothetical protein